jgi:hypothetical protein
MSGPLLATKMDVQEVKGEIQEVRAEIKELELRMDAKFAQVDVKAAQLETKIAQGTETIIKWLLMVLGVCQEFCVNSFGSFGNRSANSTVNRLRAGFQ